MVVIVGKVFLIVGGTGSIGVNLAKYLLHQSDAGEIIVFSRDEQKHFEMSKKYDIQYIIGDIRDRERLIDVCSGVDVIIHTAAMKHVPIAEENPFECVKTNILGTQNIIDAAILNGVERVIGLSSDKAVFPINVYGASKLYLERLMIDADKKKETIFSVVRYANVFGSKGSVVPFFLEKKREGYLPITHADMTRFSITMRESLDLIFFAIKHGWGGEIIVPVSPSYRILDVAEAVAPNIERRFIGIRPGEKMHETLIGLHESDQTVRRENFYIICPKDGRWDRKKYCSETDSLIISEGFEYISSTNNNWLAIDDIRKLIDDFDEF
jgi:FlaA1/EpsC-like NDP-sugar epimerase